MSLSRTTWPKPSTPARSRSFASSSAAMCAMTRMPCVCASSMIARYRFGFSFSTVPFRSSTQILMKSGRLAASSRTSRARLGLGRDAVRRVAHRHARSGIGHRKAAARGEQARARVRLLPDLKRQDAPARAGFEDSGHAVIRKAVELVDEVAGRVVLRREGRTVAVAEMHVRVHERRHHRLAGEIYPPRTRGRRQGTLRADLREASVLDDERGVLDRRAVIAGDQARALEERRRACFAPATRRRAARA